ncbi:MAG TPA: hypothetical protein DEV72_07450, partial [Ktedonobacter sp.]|nr:hypothetical protein [Ktedonobacter sp.]
LLSVLLSTRTGKMQRAGPFGAVEHYEKTRDEEVILRFLVAGLFLRVLPGFLATAFCTDLEWD